MARKKAPKAPTIEEILEKFRDAEAFWKPLHSQMETGHRIFNRKLNVEAPTGYNVIYPDTGYTIVMTAADHIAGDAPKVQVPEAGLAKKSQERSEDLERALQAALYRFERAQNENVARTLVINGLWSGMMVSQGPLFLADAWGDEPIASDYEDKEEYASDRVEYDTTKKLEWPFLWKAVDPRHVYPDPGTTGRKWVIISYERTAGSVKAQWPQFDMRLPGSSGQDKELPESTKLQWMEFWSETHRAYLVGHIAPSANSTAFWSGAKAVDAIRPHRYAKPPFQIRSAGYGNDSGQPDERFRALFWAAESLIEAEIRAYSHRDALIRRTAWTQMLAPIGSGFDSMEPGTVKEIPDEKIALIRPVSEVNPIAIQAVAQEIDDLDAAIQKATVPNVVQGIRAKGIASGYGQNSLVAQAKVRYGAAARNLQALLEEFLVDLGRCVENVVGEDVPVWGHTRWGLVNSVLRPSDIDGLRYVVVTINPKLPADRANEITIGGTLLKEGVIDTDFYLQEYVGVEQPGEMRERVLRDRALQDPAIVRVLALAAALKGGYIDYVFDAAKQIGMDPGQLLAVLGFGNPSQQAPGANQGTGAPMNVGAQQGPSMFGGAEKSQPAPGGPSDIRDRAVPGVSIGGAA